MRQQPVKAGADAHRTKNIVADWQPQQAPPAEDVWQECQRNQQMKQSDGNDVRPDDATFVIDQLGSWNSSAAYRGCRSVDRDQLVKTVALDDNVRRCPLALLRFERSRHQPDSVREWPAN